MKTDTLFFYNSELRKYFNLSKSIDPFLQQLTVTDNSAPHKII